MPGKSVQKASEARTVQRWQHNLRTPLGVPMVSRGYSPASRPAEAPEP